MNTKTRPVFVGNTGRLVEMTDAQIEDLQVRQASPQERIADLERRVKALEKLMSKKP
jgi:hypothetical protein